MNKVLNFIKKEPVLIVAFFLAIISVIFIKPTGEKILSCIDFRTLSLLFCLMIIIQAFKSIHVLDWIAGKLLRFAKNKRSLYFILVYIVFFISMFMTNDVALLTFVPLTILICSRIDQKYGTLIILETLAANLGSCVTPMGNPQNLYLHSFYNFSLTSFFSCTLKIGIPSLIILAMIIIFLTKDNKKFEGNMLQNQIVNIKPDWKFALFVCAFLIAILTVFHLIDFRITLIVTILIIGICNFRLFSKVDYSLIFTFVGFFIFTGLFSNVEQISNFLQNELKDPLKTYLTGIISSQIISNVPASLLLSGFTENSKELLLGVNVGGLGTLIASMASLISFKLYKNSPEAATSDGKKYFLNFSIYNFSLLILLGILVWFMN